MPNEKIEQGKRDKDADETALEQLASQRFGFQTRAKFDNFFNIRRQTSSRFSNARKDFRIGAKRDAPPRHGGM
jgi:hypothetical protein